MKTLNLHDPQVWQAFRVRALAYVPSELEQADFSDMLIFLYQQGIRPAKRSDGLGASYSALSLFEGVYERILHAVAVDLEALDHAERAGSGEGGDSGGLAE